MWLEKYFAAQSLDNQILVYSTDNFRQARNKRFAGHSVAGYACQVGFSPDGKWISSGDGEGNVVFWEWKTGRIKSRLRAHSKVVIAHEWLPHETVCLNFPRVRDIRTPAHMLLCVFVVEGCDGIVGWVDQALGTSFAANMPHCRKTVTDLRSIDNCRTDGRHCVYVPC